PIRQQFPGLTLDNLSQFTRVVALHVRTPSGTRQTATPRLVVDTLISQRIGQESLICTAPLPIPCAQHSMATPQEPTCHAPDTPWFGLYGLIRNMLLNEPEKSNVRQGQCLYPESKPGTCMAQSRSRCTCRH